MKFFKDTKLILNKASEVLPKEATVIDISRNAYEVKLQAIYHAYLYQLTYLYDSNTYSLCTFKSISIKEV